jgi:hypothetical protein
MNTKPKKITKPRTRKSVREVINKIHAKLGSKEPGLTDFKEAFWDAAVQVPSKKGGQK